MVIKPHNATLGPQGTTADNDRLKKTVAEGNGLCEKPVCISIDGGWIVIEIQGREHS